MSANDVGVKALNGEREWIAVYLFEIQEDMVMEFEGAPCNIVDGDGNLVAELGPKDGKVERDVHAKYLCYVMRSWVKFQKKAQAADDVGAKALNGEREWITVYSFEIQEDMVMEFEGASCNIVDGVGNIVAELGPKDGKTERDVHAKYLCYVMRSWVKFQKKAQV
ncbi:hypothetical protein N7461_001431 [Penicillium sp. DV-2018c]|nr:hypothetical protein N7461_001431 [Penicillium sp. DV-2018c]